MESKKSKEVNEDAGMAVYDYIVNNVEKCRDELPQLIDKLMETDINGIFLASTARFLTAVDREAFAEFIPRLIEGTIEKDRERKYLGSLMEAIWGKGYEERREELAASDNNFRRIYKRLHPTGF